MKSHENRGPDADEIRRQIESLLTEYGGTMKLTEALRFAPGFENFNRTTIYRWTKATGPSANIDLEKAARAVAFLRSRKKTMRLAFAVPRTLQSLPVMLLGWDDVYGGEGHRGWGVKTSSPYGLLRRRGVDCPMEPCSGGYEALALLREPKSRFDIALAGREFGAPASRDDELHRMCRIVRAQWSGIAKMSLRSIHELNQKIVGYNPQTAILYKLDRIEKRLGIKFERKPCNSALDFVNLFRSDEGKDLVVLGWDPLLSEIKDEFCLQTGEKLKDVRFADNDHWEYAVDVDLFVRESASSAAVRIFLDALDFANEYVNDPSNRNEITSVCIKKLPDWRLTGRMVASTVTRERTIYKIGDLSQWITRFHWQKEIDEMNARST